MNYQKILSIIFFVNVLLGINDAFCMEKGEQREYILLKEMTKKFFVELLDKYLDLCREKRKKAAIIDNYICGDFKDNDKVEKSRFFDEYWECTVMERSPVSIKLENKEQNTCDVLEGVTGGDFEKYREVLKKELTNNLPGGILSMAINDLLRFCCPSCMKDLLAIKKIYRGFLENATSKADAQQIVKKYYEEIKPYKREIETRLCQSAFFLNQVPEIRKHIFRVTLKSAKNKKNREFRKFIKYLKQEYYYCCTTPKTPEKIELESGPIDNMISVYEICGLCGKDLNNNQEQSKLSCCHTLHTSCLARWIVLRRNESIEDRCPQCKKDKEVICI